MLTSFLCSETAPTILNTSKYAISVLKYFELLFSSLSQLERTVSGN